MKKTFLIFAGLVAMLTIPAVVGVPPNPISPVQEALLSVDITNPWPGFSDVGTLIARDGSSVFGGPGISPFAVPSDPHNPADPYTPVDAAFMENDLFELELPGFSAVGEYISENGGFLGEPGVSIYAYPGDPS